MFKFCKKNPQDLNLDPERSDESIGLPIARPPISWSYVNEIIFTPIHFISKPDAAQWALFLLWWPRIANL